MKIPNNLKSASKLLLNLLIANCGGYSVVGRTTGLERQTLHLACINGYITLQTVYKVSKALNINQWALSYIKLFVVFGEDSKKFETVVENCDILSQEDKDKILKVYRKA